MGEIIVAGKVSHFPEPRETSGYCLRVKGDGGRNSQNTAGHRDRSAMVSVEGHRGISIGWRVVVILLFRTQMQFNSITSFM